MTEALVIHGGALGDFVLSLRVVAALRRNGSQRITLLGRPEYFALARQAGVDDELDLNSGGHHSLFSEDFAPSRELKDHFERFDLAVDMLAGPGSRFHRNLSSLGIGRVLSIDPRPRPNWPGHISDQWLDDLRGAGLAAEVGPPRIVPDLPALESGRRQWVQYSGARGPVALIQPGSGSRVKCWPTDRFIRLIRELQLRWWGVVILLGPVEQERFEPATLTSFRMEAPVIENRPLNELAGLVAAADCFVGNDSGVTHLAAAVGTPTLAIFGPTDPKRWRPLGDHVRVVSVGTGNWPDPVDILDAVETMAAKSKDPVA